MRRMILGTFILRAIFIIVATALGYMSGPILKTVIPPYNSIIGGAVGFMAAVVVILSIVWAKKNELKVVISAVFGLIIGIIIANLISYTLIFKILKPDTFTFTLFILTNFIFAYLGCGIGIMKGPEISFRFLRRLPGESQKEMNYKILDTSVIIDGRISDLCETGFIEGIFQIPQFVLRELQHIADSSDPIKRTRGRRGLDILQKLQKQIDIDVEITDVDFPKIREVDAKLIALAQKNKGKIITNDFNLNKVAELQGVDVLNINQLANALKPVVLPGEIMNVRILKEGKEEGQGVAYLDDGTMVVVDNARKLMGKNVDVSVTSVLQTTAGRMIFTVLKSEEADRVYENTSH
ncbi:MAG: TRAM domain-containing protein [Deltaproteobacteria bacterium]|uniref:TRAM domain-containing protein n=1 Tax=Candidatus Zymogenus saltonus TaxID=2844893 RepID=A0A9D8PJX3_9DELT|nr:TRAM domain-containing protein [Candidatus Zymogenus saltonus]